jgi:hypothetical protein
MKLNPEYNLLNSSRIWMKTKETETGSKGWHYFQANRYPELSPEHHTNPLHFPCNWETGEKGVLVSASEGRRIKLKWLCWWLPLYPSHPQGVSWPRLGTATHSANLPLCKVLQQGNPTTGEILHSEEETSHFISSSVKWRYSNLRSLTALIWQWKTTQGKK